jgi:hypothetical protein
MGSDQVALGNGNDTLVADSDWVNDSNADTIDGGAGFDSIAFFGASLNLDLSNLTRFGDGRLENIERIDITGSGNNTLLVDSSQVMEITDLLATDAVLIIDGNAGDTVDLSNEGTRAAAGVSVKVDINGDGDTDLNDAGENMTTTANGSVTANFGNGAASYWVYSDSTSPWGKLLVNTAVTII